MAISPENLSLLNHAQYLANAGFIPVLVPSIRLVRRESGLQPECQCHRKERCMTPGKHPVKGWKQTPMDTPAQGLESLTKLVKEARSDETFNLGLRTGMAGGIFAIDIDHKPDGFSGYGNWSAFLTDHQINDPYYYETLTAETGGGGRHYIYRYPKNGDIVQNAVCHIEFNYSQNEKDRERSAIDVRGEGGIIIVCPSRHKSGNFYQWLNDPATSLREETPSAILRAVAKKRESRDPDSDYTPDLEELQNLAERLAKDKKRPNNVAIGQDLRDVLQGIAIHTNGGAHEPFQKLTFRLALEYPRASAAELMSHMAESIAERESAFPDGSCTHDDVFSLLKGALAKCREKADHWESKLLRTKTTGSIISCQQNVESFLRNDPLWQGVFATNARSQRKLVMRHPPRAILGALEHNRYPRPLLDVDVDNVVTNLEIRYEVPFSREHARTSVRKLCTENVFDPFLHYLEQLPPWDGVERVDTWLTVLGGAEDSPINRAFGAIWLLQAVYRTLNPGCQADYTLILEGPQGIGKSSMLRALVPTSDLFDDGLKPIDHTAGKDNLSKLAGPLILELAELGALRRGDVEHIKAFLTAREDTYRPPYHEESKTEPRRCVFVGTTNSNHYLRDSTGNRRFFPVQLASTRIDIDQVKAHRDQIWSETLLRARRGEPPYLSPELEEAANAVQEDHKAEEPWQKIVEDWLDEAWDRIQKVTCHDLTTPETEKLGPESEETTEDPDAVASMYWLEKYDTEKEVPLDAEDVRRYGEIEHFAIDDILEHNDVPVAQRSFSIRESIRNVLVSMGYEKIRIWHTGKYYGKRRWLRKPRK